MTALYLERYLNFGLTREELQSARPIIGIAQTGSDLSPCNRIHIELASRLRDGIRDAGGLPLEFPCHPIQETGRRPTAALDRNLCFLSLLEVLHGYPLDGVILTTGCDKTTPALLMAAAAADLPAIVSSGGPMLDGHWRGSLAGSGAVIWESRRLLAAGEIDDDEFFERVCSSAPSPGHCNTMGTASTSTHAGSRTRRLTHARTHAQPERSARTRAHAHDHTVRTSISTAREVHSPAPAQDEHPRHTSASPLAVNALAEALGMSLPGCAAIPAPYRERAQMAYRTGMRAVELVREDLRPSAILTRDAFLNAIRYT
jgi:dihydroxyacid dehydratase/phosphogluconate dehydratase